jgi:hypothetical protein
MQIVGVHGKGRICIYVYYYSTTRYDMERNQKDTSTALPALLCMLPPYSSYPIHSVLIHLFV